MWKCLIGVYPWKLQESKGQELVDVMIISLIIRLLIIMITISNQIISSALRTLSSFLLAKPLQILLISYLRSGNESKWWWWWKRPLSLEGYWGCGWVGSGVQWKLWRLCLRTGNAIKVGGGLAWTLGGGWGILPGLSGWMAEATFIHFISILKYNQSFPWELASFLDCYIMGRFIMWFMVSQ